MGVLLYWDKDKGLHADQLSLFANLNRKPLLNKIFQRSCWMNLIYTKK